MSRAPNVRYWPDQFDDSKNEYPVYICVEDYIRLRKAMPVPMQVFQAWFCAAHIDLLEPEHPAFQKFLALFPGIDGMTRQQQKRGVAAVIDDQLLLAGIG